MGARPWKVGRAYFDSTSHQLPVCRDRFRLLVVLIVGVRAGRRKLKAIRTGAAM